MSREVGTLCKLQAVHWHGPPPEPGDLIHTTGGSWYVVDEARPGRTEGRYGLRCVRLGKERPPQADEDVVWEWEWLPREATRVRAKS